MTIASPKALRAQNLIGSFEIQIYISQSEQNHNSKSAFAHSAQMNDI